MTAPQIITQDAILNVAWRVAAASVDALWFELSERPDVLGNGDLLVAYYDGLRDTAFSELREAFQIPDNTALADGLHETVTRACEHRLERLLDQAGHDRGSA